MEDIAPRTVLELLEVSARRTPEADAVFGVDPSLRLGYAELLERSLVVGRALRASGIAPTDSVLVSLPNGPEILVAILGTMCAAVCAPMNPGYTSTELDVQADDIGPTAVVVGAGSAPDVLALARRRGLTVIDVSTLSGLVTADALSPNPDAPALLLHTAGTTARPKQVPLTHSNLVAAAANVVTSLLLDSRDRCLNVMPLFHSHGLLGAALSTLRAGASIVCAPGMDPRRFLDWAEEYKCSWYTAAPTIHHLVLAAPGEWTSARFMRSASAPLPPQIAIGLEERFGAPLIEVYGMTEAYQIAANPLPPGERRLGTVGRATGTEIAIFDGQDTLRATGGPGEVVVRGPTVFTSYCSPPGANSEAFIDGWFRTGDLGSMSDDGYLALIGRVKEQINRGGEKIAPREVEEALLDHPDVVEAMIFALPDEELGEEIAVALVLRSGAFLDPRGVRSFLRGSVAPFKMPKVVVLVDEIPKSSTGKPQRLAFAREHASQMTANPSPVLSTVSRAANSTEDWLGAVWQQILELHETPERTDSFFDLGGTSLSVMELVVRIDDELGIELPLLDVLQVPSLGALATFLDELAAGGSQKPLLQRYRSGASDRSIVLVPGMDGMAIGLHLIADAIETDATILLFDYPGQRPGQRPMRSIEALAEALVAELDRANLVGDLSIYGNSMGSWVALETARVLEARGRCPRFVGIGDMYSPFFNSHESPLRPPIARRVRNRLRRLKGHLLREVAARTGANGHEAAAVARRSAVIAASVVARRAYTAQPYAGDVLVLVASERGPKFGRTLGYERHVTGRIDTVEVDAQHSDMHRSAAKEIGAALSRMLDATQES